MKKLFIFILISVALASIAFFVLFLSINIPDFTNPNEVKIAQSTKIYDRTGKILLYDVHGSEKRTVIAFDDIPRTVKNATVALEDDTFYQHYGIRPLAILRSLFVDLFKGKLEQGGSTITQQLVKNTLLGPEKTIWRKIKEIILTFKMEGKYSKDQILGLYLNQILYGNSSFGIEAAAENFFNKHAPDLTPLESAYLASLPNAPSYYSPYGKHRNELDTRAQYTLKRMFELGFLSQKEYNSAKNEKIVFTPQKIQGIIAPHFVMDILEELNSKYGEDVINTSGFVVTTTLDTDIQQKAEEVVSKYAPINEQNFNAKNEGIISIDPKTGDILAMVGSRDYFDNTHEGNFNVTTAHRQPGSSFKPFVYATAFKKGYTPDTVLFDLPTEFNPSCLPDGTAPFGIDPSRCYHPQNFDNKFRGPVTLKEALAQSLNVPSVKVLYLAGIGDSLNTARDFGITSLSTPDRYGLTLVLGGGEVSLLELTSAYSVFANDGIKNQPRDILNIKDSSEKIIYETELNPAEVIDKNIARTISSMLSDDKARVGEFPILYFPGKNVAAKTGTTNNYKDAWVLGYTPNITIGAWAGNNNNTPMEKKIAGFIVAPMWHELMDYVLTSKFPSSDFSAPDSMPANKPVLKGEWRGGSSYVIDKSSGKLATDYTPQDQKEEKVIQSVHSILYWLDKDNPLDQAPSSPASDPQFKNWEASVRSWAYSNGYLDQNSSVIPTSYDDTHTPDQFPQIQNIQITPVKEIYSSKDSLFIEPIINAKYGVLQVDFFINEKYLGSVNTDPFGLSVNLNNISNNNQSTTIRVRVYDKVGNTADLSKDIVIK